MIWQRLNNSFYYNGSIRYRVLQAFGFAAFVFFFLFVFRPYGILEMQPALWITCSCFALATLVPMLFLNVLIPPFIKSFFNEDKWTVGREVIWSLVNIIVIGFWNYYYFQISVNGVFAWKNALLFQGFTIAIGIFPIALLALLREKKDRIHYTEEASGLNEVLEATNEIEQQESKVIESKPETFIEVRSLNAAETLHLNLSDLLVIQSADNYIDVHYLKDGRLVKSVLRNTLKAVTDELSEHQSLFRCHKSYLVNLHHVHHISGNAQGYKLRLKQMEELIPVSRSYNNSIKELLAIHH
jgi:DNA-binding LytR/AlgR family response regulator